MRRLAVLAAVLLTARVAHATPLTGTILQQWAGPSSPVCETGPEPFSFVDIFNPKPLVTVYCLSDLEMTLSRRPDLTLALDVTMQVESPYTIFLDYWQLHETPIMIGVFGYLSGGPWHGFEYDDEPGSLAVWHAEGPEPRDFQLIARYSTSDYGGVNEDIFGTMVPLHVLHVTPEPATLALLGTGLLALGVATRRRRA